MKLGIKYLVPQLKGFCVGTWLRVDNWEKRQLGGKLIVWVWKPLANFSMKMNLCPKSQERWCMGGWNPTTHRRPKTLTTMEWTIDKAYITSKSPFFPQVVTILQLMAKCNAMQRILESPVSQKQMWMLSSHHTPLYMTSTPHLGHKWS